MEEKTYNMLLTIILVIIGIALMVGGGIIISNLVKDKNVAEENKEVVDAFQTATSNKKSGKEKDNKNKNKESNIEPGSSNILDPNNFSGNAGSKITNVKMENYNVVGIIKIPKIKLEYPILEKVTKRSLEISVAQLDTQRGINNPGNTTILGHNYRNNLFFAKLHLLQPGDKIMVTDVSGEVVTYEVYEINTRTPSDTSYISRDTEGRREISLSTCNDDSTLRHVVLAREVQ